MEQDNTNCCCGHHNGHQAKAAGKWVFSFGFVLVLVIFAKPFMADQLIRRADAYYCSGLYDDAIRQYEKAILLDKSDSDIWVSLGNSLQANKEYSKAMAAFKEAVKVAPENRAANFHLGAAFVINKDYKSAIAYLEKVRSSGSEPEEELLGGGFSYYSSSLEMLAGCFEKLRQFEKEAAIREQLRQSRRGEP